MYLNAYQLKYDAGEFLSLRDYHQWEKYVPQYNL